MSKPTQRQRGSQGRGPSKSPRLLWGDTGPRLFDAQGREYSLHARDLPAKEVNRFVRRAQVPFAVKHCGAGVDWFEVPDCAAAWDRIRPDFEDVDDWRPPADAPGAQPYRAELWQAITGRDQVLLLTNE